MSVAHASAVTTPCCLSAASMYSSRSSIVTLLTSMACGSPQLHSASSLVQLLRRQISTPAADNRRREGRQGKGGTTSARLLDKRAEEQRWKCADDATHCTDLRERNVAPSGMGTFV